MDYAKGYGLKKRIQQYILKIGETVVKSKLSARIKICDQPKFCFFKITYFPYANRQTKKI
jgi:hypothetical protein